MNGKFELVFTAIVIKDKDSEKYTAILKEIDGVIAQGNSADEAVEKLPAVFAGLIEARREDTYVEMPKYNPQLMTERELVFVR